MRTEIWRRFSRRAMMLAPLTTWMLGQLGQRHAPAVARRDQDVADGMHVGARLGHVAHGDVESPLAFEERADGASADRQLDHVLHVAHVDPVARHARRDSTAMRSCA